MLRVGRDTTIWTSEGENNLYIDKIDFKFVQMKSLAHTLKKHPKKFSKQKYTVKLFSVNLQDIY